MGLDRIVMSRFAAAAAAAAALTIVAIAGLPPIAGAQTAQTAQAAQPQPQPQPQTTQAQRTQAQRTQAQTAAAVSSRWIASLVDTSAHEASAVAPTWTRHRGFAPLVSLVVPGGGQFMLGNERSVAYAAIEALSWWSYAKDSREQKAQESDFKSLARTVARAHFTTGSPNDLPDAPWSYYEAMRDHLESGQYSLAVSGPVVPETDPTTYNGFLWVLAQSTNTSYAGALAQYERTAIKPQFEWSWRNAQLQFDLYTRHTLLRDDAYNAGTRALLIIGANHVLSMVDAFTTVRLRARAEADGRTSIGASFPW